KSFPCQRRLVYHAFPTGNYTVKWDHVSHVDNDCISTSDTRGMDQDLLFILFQPDFLDIQGHAARKVAHGFLVRPFFQYLPDPEKEHDRSCRIEIPPQDRNPNGGG